MEELEIVAGATAVNPLRFVAYPWSHSLVALGAWGILLATLTVVLRRGRWRQWRPWRDAAIVVGVVLSHWVLDVASHLPDMPLTIGGETRLGPLPPSDEAVAWSAQALWLLVLFGW